MIAPMPGPHVALVSGARSAVRPTDGELSNWHPVELAGVVGCEVLERAGISSRDLDEVIVGCSEPVGANGADAARAIVLGAGWDPSVGGHVIDRAETSGAAALHAAVAAIISGQAKTVLVVGLGICSVVPAGASAVNRTYGAPWGPVAQRLADRGGLLPAPRLAERAAAAAGLGRVELDAIAERSRELRRIRQETAPVESIVALAARPGRASRMVRRGAVVADDVIRGLGDPGRLSPLFDEDGLLTAASFAPPADAIAAVLLRAAPPRPESGSESLSSEGSGWEPKRPLGMVLGVGRAAGDPFDPVSGVEDAVSEALAAAGIALADIAVVEVVESTAVTVPLVARILGIEPDRLNPHGGTLASGDAGAAEELRLVLDGLHALDSLDEEGRNLLTISTGPTGSAATIWRH